MDATGLDVNGALHEHVLLEAQLQATLNIIPAHAWYALPNGHSRFLNERAADYLGLPTDHPLRLGTGSGVYWESHILFLAPGSALARLCALTRRIAPDASATSFG